MVSIDVWLYGPLARYVDGENKNSFANRKVEVPEGTRLRDLLAQMSIPTAERGITFINGKLTAMPGKQPDLDQILFNEDRIALFHLNSMWPFQYRHGVAMGDDLKGSATEKAGIFRHRSQ